MRTGLIAAATAAAVTIASSWALADPAAQPPAAPPATPVTAAPPAAAPAVAAPAAAAAPVAAPTPAAAAAAPPAAPPPAATAPVPAPAAQPQAQLPPAKPQLGALVRQRIEALSAGATELEAKQFAALTAFYQARGDQPLWVSDGALNDRAVLAIAEIQKADAWGLDPAAFETPNAAGALTDATAAEAEFKLSIAALSYAHQARGGRIEDPARQLSSYVDRTPQLLESKVVLERLASAAAPDATLRGFHPQHPQFEKLRQHYLALLKSAATAEVILLPKGPVLSPGQRHAHVALLRKRLKAPLPAATDGQAADETLYDATLVEAVKAFQTQAGLAADGIVGAGSKAALNDIDVPSPERVRANMEMWRWMPDDLGATHVWVNLPEFTYQFVRDGKVVHEERVITGLVDKQTPTFSADMDMVTVHPRWNVPDSIKVRELYPSLARGGTYFQKQGLRMTKNGRVVDPYSVDWGSADIRQFDVHQPPGAANVLGLFKFTFHNKHIVYMHDTPTKHLFERVSRPFSHGCVRVQNPERLAELVLGADKGWTPEQVAELANGNPAENPIPLQSKIPVHIVYFTEHITDTGEAVTFKDVYGHEERVKLALEGRFDAIARGADHLAPVKYERRDYAGGTTLDTFFNNLFGGF